MTNMYVYIYSKYEKNKEEILLLCIDAQNCA